MTYTTAATVWTESTRLRANPAYDVVSRDALPPALDAVSRALEGTPELFGVALPRDPSRQTAKALDCDTALLLLTLREPATLPWFARAKLGHRASPMIEALILDGVLEVERGGAFVSGPAALADAAEFAPPDARPARLSRAALAYGAALALGDAPALARRLYCYHTVPLSPAWQTALIDRAAVERFLRLDGGDTRRALTRHWKPAPRSSRGSEEHWLWWDVRRRDHTRRVDAAYKLYVSCATERLADALGAVVDVLARRGGVPFKVGASAGGLLRPDKLVIYVDRLDEVLAIGAALRSALHGIPAHGVPFTAPITADGLLSWGIDPPRAALGVMSTRRQSWRARLTMSLATSLAAARRDGAGVGTAVRFAVERIRRDGVDPETWAPRSHEWEAMAADD